MTSTFPSKSVNPFGGIVVKVTIFAVHSRTRWIATQHVDRLFSAHDLNASLEQRIDPLRDLDNERDDSHDGCDLFH